MGSAGLAFPHSGCSRRSSLVTNMHAMQVEKDNACDKMDACEEAMKTAKVRAQKGENEVAELDAKAKQLETELDLTAEKLGYVSLQLEEKEKALSAAELEMNALTRRVSGLEEDLEKTEEKLLVANQKFDKAATAADDSERTSWWPSKRSSRRSTRSLNRPLPRCLDTRNVEQEMAKNFAVIIRNLISQKVNIEY